MLNKKSKDASEGGTSGKKQKKGKKEKKPKLTPEEKAVKKKDKVEKQSAVTIKKAQEKVKKAEQAIKNKEKAAEKKEKKKEQQIANKIKKQEQSIEKKIKNKELKKEKKAEDKIRKREQKIEEKAEKMQRKAELAARSPMQKKIDRQVKIKRLLLKLLVLLIVAGLVFAGVKFAPKIIEKLDLPKISVSEVIGNVKAKIPFLNKEKKEEEPEKEEKDEKEKEKEAPPEEEVVDDPTLYISGTSVLEPFYTQALADFLGIKKKEAKLQSVVADVSISYTNLINGDEQVIFGSLPTEKESKMAELAGVDLQPIPIINGALVFFVDKGNPVKSLTMTQVYNIYSGTITNWKDLGGNDEPIVAFQRSENSGSQSGMYKHVISQNEIMKVSDDMKVSETKDIVKEVQSQKGAIGYSYYYYMENLKNSDDVKLISVNGVKPDRKNIASSAYPLTTYSYAIITTEEKTKSLSDIISSVDNQIDAEKKDDGGKEDKKKDKKADEAATEGAVETKPEPLPLKLQFVQWMLSEEGQKLVEENGFIRHD